MIKFIAHFKKLLNKRTMTKEQLIQSNLRVGNMVVVKPLNNLILDIASLDLENGKVGFKINSYDRTINKISHYNFNDIELYKY